jgi:hypothetical protein
VEAGALPNQSTNHHQLIIIFNKKKKATFLIFRLNNIYRRPNAPALKFKLT